MLKSMAGEVERERDALLMAVRDVARELRVSGRHVWKLSAAGKMPAPLRCGRAVRWRRSEIEAWIAMGAPDRETFDAHHAAGVAK